MTEYKFDAEKWTPLVIQWIKDWMSENGSENTRVVIGLSGGKDSSVVAALLEKALGRERVVGVFMPDGEQKDISDSFALAEHLNLRTFTVNIHQAYEGLRSEFSAAGIAPSSESFSPAFRTNTPARLRMTVLYGIAAQLGDCRVVNTCNLSEDLQGYSTFYGDSAGDFSPLRMFTTDEVVAIGDFLGLPEFLTHKAPSDGMCGKTDEDNLGYTYREVNLIARQNIRGENAEKIIARYKANRFKVRILNLPCFKPDLPLFFEL